MPFLSFNHFSKTQGIPQACHVEQNLLIPPKRPTESIPSYHPAAPSPAGYSECRWRSCTPLWSEGGKENQGISYITCFACQEAPTAPSRRAQRSAPEKWITIVPRTTSWKETGRKRIKHNKSQNSRHLQAHCKILHCPWDTLWKNCSLAEIWDVSDRHWMWEQSPWSSFKEHSSLTALKSLELKVCAENVCAGR